MSVFARRRYGRDSVSRDDGNGDDGEHEVELFRDDDLVVARHLPTGVVSQGYSAHHALEMLEEAVELHHGVCDESIDSWDEQAELLEDIGINPEEVKQSREGNSDLPDFMQ